DRNTPSQARTHSPSPHGRVKGSACGWRFHLNRKSSNLPLELWAGSSPDLWSRGGDWAVAPVQALRAGVPYPANVFAYSVRSSAFWTLPIALRGSTLATKI